MNRYFILCLMACLAVSSLTYAQSPKPSASIAKERSELSVAMQRRTDLVINLANVLRGTSFEPKDTALVTQTRAAEFKQVLSATPWSNEVNVAKICLAYNQVHEPLSTVLQHLDKQPQVKNMELIKETLTQLNWCEKKIKELAINYAAVCKKYNKQEMLLPNAGLKSVKVNL